jgi:hypothetical protein
MPRDKAVEPPKTYPKDYQSCRANGHEWQHLDGLVDHPEYYTIKGVESECSGCGAVVDRWQYADGRRFGSATMKYPPGYLLSRKDPQTPELPTRVDWRRTYVHRLGFREDTPKKKNGGSRATGSAVA